MPVQLSLMPVNIPHPVIEALPPAVERLGHTMVSLLVDVDGTFEILETRRKSGCRRRGARDRVNDRIGGGEFENCGQPDGFAGETESGATMSVLAPPFAWKV